MRDPDASLQMARSTVVRRLNQPLASGHFLGSELAQNWQARGCLVSFQIADDKTIVAERLPFVSQPSEWCDAQLFEAARLTLQLQQEAVAQGFDLKDAPAWNVIFAGTRPVFCDLLSFVPLNLRRWWAAGQYARHFLIPLVLSHRRGLRTHLSFRSWRDGVPPEVARRMLGPARFLSRYWPLVAEGPSAQPFEVMAEQTGSGASRKEIQRFRSGLHSTLDWMLRGVQPRQNRSAGWQTYETQREHYGAPSVEAKRGFVEEWIRQIGPAWVVDLGCNTGEFSRMALAAGAEVVAIDADHDSVQRLFLSHPNEQRLHAVVAPLDDLSGGRGWLGSEHPGMVERLGDRFDLVLMLALIHHLAVGFSIPLEQIAALAARLSRRWLMVEWIGEQDPQMQLLCGQRQRLPSEFDIAHQRAAFETVGFTVEAERKLPGTARLLALMKKVS